MASGDAWAGRDPQAAIRRASPCRRGWTGHPCDQSASNARKVPTWKGDKLGHAPAYHLAMVGAGDRFSGMRLHDRYELQEQIGAGGMGVVYRAQQIGLDRAVAVKLLSPGRASDSAWLAQFSAEAQALARLQHPNTVRVFEFGTFDGLPFPLMELLGGRTLAQELERRGRLPPPRALKILIQLCNSLEEAHRAGIIHGDVKPQNVFMLDVE